MVIILHSTHDIIKDLMVFRIATMIDLWVITAAVVSASWQAMTVQTKS